MSRERERKKNTQERDRQKLAEDQPPFNEAFDVKQSVTDTFLMSRKKSPHFQRVSDFCIKMAARCFTTDEVIGFLFLFYRCSG